MLSISALFLAIASAFLLYSLNYDSRLLAAKVQAQEQYAEKLRGDIAVLKAERAHLARPERIEPLARAQGLKPLDERQVVTMSGAANPIITGTAARQ